MAAKKKTAKKRPLKKPSKRVARKPVGKSAADMATFLARGREAKPDSIAYILRAARKDMTSHNDFVWPSEGPASAPDWKQNQECGNGLHGWLWGKGAIASCGYALDEGSRWLVCAVWAADVVDLGQKVKVPRAWVVFCGDAPLAAERIGQLGAKDGVIFGSATAGDGGSATAGAHGSATAGDGGSATAGDGGSATAGDGGSATAGDGGSATAGDGGSATAGDRGSATAGDRGSATAGDGGSATAGDDGMISILHYNCNRWKYKRGSIGENGLEPGVKYRLSEAGEFVRVPDAAVAP